MQDRIPQEVRAMMDEFKATDPGWKQKQKKEKQPDIPKIGTVNDIERLARDCGYVIRGGGGNHGRRVETPDGQYICSVPTHGGSGQLARGTWNSILESLGLRK